MYTRIVTFHLICQIIVSGLIPCCTSRGHIDKRCNKKKMNGSYGKVISVLGEIQSLPIDHISYD